MDLIYFFGGLKNCESPNIWITFLSLREYLEYFFVSLHICCYSEHLVNISCGPTCEFL